MSLKSSLAITAGKGTQWFLKTFLKGGSSLPGKIALSIDPNILEELAKDYEIIVVTGTNGKTLTTSIIVNILKQKYDQIITNPTGANMKQGIVATFLSAPHHKDGRRFAVLEIDEATLPHVTQFIKPNVFVFTNIFRDQLDRYGEIYTTYNLIATGAKNAPEATVIANGDTPIFNNPKLKNPHVFFGFNHKKDKEMLADINTDGILCPNCHNILHYKMNTYSNLGKYYCPHCGFKRPELTTQLTELVDVTDHSSTFIVDDMQYHLEVGGLYNIYNALAAIAVGEFYGIDKEDIKQGLAESQNVFGRQEVIQVDDKKVTIMLVKNPVGLNQVLDTIQLAGQPFSLISLLNDKYADGIDVSWIWDGHYEQLSKMDIPKAVVGGKRYKDMALRLKVAGLEDCLIIEDDNQKIIDRMKEMPTENIYVLATYTAMLELRQLLKEKGYIK